MTSTKSDHQPLKQALALPCGGEIKNRFFKAAMSETLATKQGAPSPLHASLYGAWADGGAGVVMTGNVMVDHRHLGEPGNVSIEDEAHLAPLRAWAAAGTRNGTHLWMQINHPGKQCPKMIAKHPVAPSAIPVRGPLGDFFNPPRALSTEEVSGVVARFVRTAAIAKKAGFTGVEIHGAHGYLVNQFLSPADNTRTDRYGGSLENRMRFLVEIYTGMREELGPEFPIALKLNSSDFGEEGFTQEESIRVAEHMAGLGLDLLEVSGGTYEKSVFEATQDDDEGGTLWAEYARALRGRVRIPTVLTGGFRAQQAMEGAVADDLTDMVGMARAMALVPDLPNQVISGRGLTTVDLPFVKTPFPWLDKKLGSFLVLSWYELQMKRIGQGKRPDPSIGGGRAVWNTVASHGLEALAPRRA